jgi:hypothetical protein
MFRSEAAMFKMSKDAMRERIQESLKESDEAEIRRRVEVCLWGLDKVKGGSQMANELIDELGLQKYGAQKFAVSV